MHNIAVANGLAAVCLSSPAGQPIFALADGIAREQHPARPNLPAARCIAK